MIFFFYENSLLKQKILTNLELVVTKSRIRWKIGLEKVFLRFSIINGKVIIPKKRVYTKKKKKLYHFIKLKKIK